MVKNSTSIQSVWNTIRQHFRFQITGAHFIDFADIHLEGNERPEDLYKRLMAFEEDVLLKANSLSHHGNLITEDEELTLSLENYVVLTWLQHVHLKLPKLVKQRYGTKLRSRTLVSIKPEISQALDSLLDEIRASDDAEVMRTATNTFRRTTLAKRLPRRGIRPPHQLKTCPIWKQTRQPDIYHFLSECRHLPEEDHKYIVQARQIADIFDDHLEDIGEMTPCMEEKWVQQWGTYPWSWPGALSPPYSDLPIPWYGDLPRPSPSAHHLRQWHYQQHDSSVCYLMPGMPCHSQFTICTPGRWFLGPLALVREARLPFIRDNWEFSFEGLVVENLDVNVLTGTPFKETNDLSVRPAKRQVILSNGTAYIYGSQGPPVVNTTVCCAMVLRALPTSTTILPGKFVEVSLPKEAPPDCVYALVLQSDSPSVRKLTTPNSGRPQHRLKHHWWNTNS